MIKTFVRTTSLGSAVALILAMSQWSANAAVLDDFNVNEGHFNQTITFSGTTVGEDPSSTADRATTDGPREGAGHQKLVLVHDATITPFRLRHVSGSGTVGNNTPFTTTDGTDGFIGFYLKTTNTGWQTSINLDGAGGVAADMDGSTSVEVIADGEWHLYEWDLDSTTWGAVPGIGGGHGGALVNSSHTIDSIYLRDLDGEAGPTAVFYLDFVAVNPNGTVADLLLDPCINTTGVLVTGPLSTNSNQVVVTGVSGTATNITVYQNTGSGSSMVPIGSKNSGLTPGNNLVTVSGLVKAALVAATQTVDGQESCIPTTGIAVGGGANPSVRVAVSIRETVSTGPIGEPGDTASGNIHFLGATVVSGGAPVNGGILYPSNDWQTVTFLRGTNEVVGDSTSATGLPVNGAGYAANDVVAIQVYAYRTLPNSARVYSATPAQSLDVTSNDVFSVNWTWDAVSGAQGYRLLRSTNFVGYTESVDVTGTTYNDANSEWTTDITVTPNSSQSGSSVQWSPSVSNTNNLPGQWGVLESINFVIDNADTGPFDLYIDNLQNGNLLFQDFEGSASGASDYVFRPPGFSGTTSSGLLSSPSIGAVSDVESDAGLNSFRLSFQWNGTNATRWLRLTTSGSGLPVGTPTINPQVLLDDPISFRLLLRPSVAPPSNISAALIGSQVVLTWEGAHQLQAASEATGTYTNVPGITLSPWTNNFAEPKKFFRLSN